MLPWILFNIALVALILFDLLRPVSAQNAFRSCLGWIFLALFFALGVLLFQGICPALQFVSAYLMELSLSIDNLFVFYLIFQYFQTPPENKPRILFWGILGALVMRLVFIVAGIALIQRLHWILPLFGLFLILMGVQMFRKKREALNPGESKLLTVLKERGSPFFATLIAIETVDLFFALDSIPAVFGITLDPFLAYTSNAFAVLGLRSFYFSMQHLMLKFSNLHYGIALILAFIGCKMILSPFYELPTIVTLAIMMAILGISVIYRKA